MLILVMGGSASGKSEIAENLCHHLHNGEKAYVATMAIADAESEKRAYRHREMRKNKGFHTIESALCDKSTIWLASKYNTVLLECMSNLLANEIYIGNKSAQIAISEIYNYIEVISKNVQNLIIVSNDIFGESMAYELETREYINALADINKRISAIADRVIESVCGIPIYLKGEI